MADIKLTPQARLTPQQQVIVAYLERGKTLTNKTALMCLGIGSLSRRMTDLKELGYDILKEKEFDERDQTWYTKYKLAPQEDA